MIFIPHEGVVSRLDSGVYEELHTIPCHLGNQDSLAVPADEGMDFIVTATLLFKYEDFDKVKVGDRVLVGGRTWVVTSPVLRQDQIFYLRNCKTTLEAIQDLN